MVEYNKNTPTEKGVYACRVLYKDVSFWLDDVFLCKMCFKEKYKQ